MGTEYTSYATNSPRTVIVNTDTPTVEIGDEGSDAMDNVVADPLTVSENHSDNDNIGLLEDVLEDPKTTETLDDPIFIRMRLFTVLIAITAFVIAGCAAYFSVSGLATLFAGAFWSIVIMGGILEIGKLVATSFLYRYWKHISLFLKSYLMIAVFVLMVITSMGIFGYLSRAHIEQQGNIQDAVVLVQRVDGEIAREQSKIDGLNERIEELKTDNIDFSDSIERQESIRDSSWSMVQSDIDFEQKQIDSIQKLLTEQLESLDNKYELDIQDLNSEQDRIDNELQLISSEEKGLFSKKQTELKQTLRSQQSEIILKKDTLRNELGSTKQKFMDGASERVVSHQEKIAGYRKQAQTSIDGANDKINEFRDSESSWGTDNLTKVSTLQSDIEVIYEKINTLTDEKFDAESKMRTVEAEVGPIKYVAEAVFDNSEKDTIEKAVRFLIIMIVFVFDPLAVSLVLAYNSLIMMDGTQDTIKPKKIVKRESKISVDSKAGKLISLFNKVKTKSGSIKNFDGDEIIKTNKK